MAARLGLSGSSEEAAIGSKSTEETEAGVVGVLFRVTCVAESIESITLEAAIPVPVTAIPMERDAVEETVKTFPEVLLTPVSVTFLTRPTVPLTVCPSTLNTAEVTVRPASGWMVAWRSNR